MFVRMQVLFTFVVFFFFSFVFRLFFSLSFFAGF